MNTTSTTTLAAIIPQVTPTARLVLYAVAMSTTPSSIAHLSEATGATPGTLEKLVRKLVGRGYLVKTANGSVSLYSPAFTTTN
ncbi:MAG: hypothetical protein JWQ49_96 [Edaphobacter sp.]|nr:hypothetical protein [Edaphobacter sp.]